MGVVGSSYLNIASVMKQQNEPEAKVLELLSKRNGILRDMIAVECNQGATHLHTVRTGLPSVAWGRLYKGTPQSKAAKQQVEDTTGFVEGLSSVDTRLLQLAGEKSANLRLSEANSYFEAMRQEIATGLFYHDTATAPDKFKGLAPRYGSYATTSHSQTSERQVINGGGVGSDNTSIWFVTWSEDCTTAIYPKGTVGGVKREDMGVHPELDASNNKFFVSIEKFTQHIGIAVKDWRMNARVANIDVSDALAGSTDLIDLMMQAYYKLDNVILDESGKGEGESNYEGKTVCYMNRDIALSLDRLMAGKGSAANGKLLLHYEEQQGRRVLMYRDVPIHICDAILNTEALVPAAT